MAQDGYWDDGDCDGDNISFHSCIDVTKDLEELRPLADATYHHQREETTQLRIRIQQEIQQLETEIAHLKRQATRGSNNNNNNHHHDSQPLLVGKRKKRMWVSYEVICDIVGAMIVDVNGRTSGILIDLRQHPYLVIPLVSRSFREAYFDFLTKLPTLRYDARHQDRVIFSRQTTLWDVTPPGHHSGKIVWPGTVGLLLSQGRLMPRLKHVDITWSSRDQAAGRTDCIGSPVECLLHLVCPAMGGILAGGTFGGGDGGGGEQAISAISHPIGDDSLVLNSAQISVSYDSDSTDEAEEKQFSIDCLLGLNASITKISFSSPRSWRPPICISGAATGSRDLSRITCVCIACDSYDPFGEDMVGWSIPLFTYLLSACGGLKLLHVVLSSKGTIYDDDDEELDNSYNAIREMSERILVDTPAIASAAAAIWVEFKFEFSKYPSPRVVGPNAHKLFRLGELKSLVFPDHNSFEMTREIVVGEQNSGGNSVYSWLTSLLPTRHGNWVLAMGKGGEEQSETEESQKKAKEKQDRAGGPKVVSIEMKT